MDSFQIVELKMKRSFFSPDKYKFPFSGRHIRPQKIPVTLRLCHISLDHLKRILYNDISSCYSCAHTHKKINHFTNKGISLTAWNEWERWWQWKNLIASVWNNYLIKTTAKITTLTKRKICSTTKTTTTTTTIFTLDGPFPWK